LAATPPRDAVAGPVPAQQKAGAAADLGTRLSVGGSHSCGVAKGGAVKCWGLNDKGQGTAPSGVYRSVSAGGTTV